MLLRTGWEALKGSAVLLVSISALSTLILYQPQWVHTVQRPNSGSCEGLMR